jgi:hypothetical protein
MAAIVESFSAHAGPAAAIDNPAITIRRDKFVIRAHPA